ncbi:MAG TPA: PTS mannitol transporter subunit IIA [Eubacteriaceae bacterium]|nr:PTS mannitol transporter subunit IIA [Eubacteriaceae bacterium]
MEILQKKNIRLNVSFKDKDEAVEMAGNMLLESGYVDESYIDLMKKREETMSTFMGNGLAIPHGVAESRGEGIIKESGIVVIQVPDGVDFGNGNLAYMVIGIAGKGDEHLEILSNIAMIFDDADNVEALKTATDPDEIYKKFTETM